MVPSTTVSSLDTEEGSSVSGTSTVEDTGTPLPEHQRNLRGTPSNWVFVAVIMCGAALITVSNMYLLTLKNNTNVCFNEHPTPAAYEFPRCGVIILTYSVQLVDWFNKTYEHTRLESVRQMRIQCNGVVREHNFEEEAQLLARIARNRGT